MTPRDEQAAPQDAVPVPEAQSPEPAPCRSPAGVVDGLYPAERLTAATVSTLPELDRWLTGSGCTPPVGSRANVVGPTVERDSETSTLVAWLETVTVAYLPEAPFRLSGHKTVTDPARFLASLRADLARRPGGARARTGALRQDIEDLVEGEIACP